MSVLTETISGTVTKSLSPSEINPEYSIVLEGEAVLVIETVEDTGLRYVLQKIGFTNPSLAWNEIVYIQSDEAEMPQKGETVQLTVRPLSDGRPDYVAAENPADLLEVNLR